MFDVLQQLVSKFIRFWIKCPREIVAKMREKINGFAVKSGIKT